MVASPQVVLLGMDKIHGDWHQLGLVVCPVGFHPAERKPWQASYTPKRRKRQKQKRAKKHSLLVGLLYQPGVYQLGSHDCEYSYAKGTLRLQASQESTAIVDPAGLRFVQDLGPAGAGGASGQWGLPIQGSHSEWMTRREQHRVHVLRHPYHRSGMAQGMQDETCLPSFLTASSFF